MNTRRKHALWLTELDTVATAMEDIVKHDSVAITDAEGNEVAELRALADIPCGHKIAMRDIPEEAHVMKYGYSIGVAAKEIPQGMYVHTHNLFSARGRGDL